MAEVPFPAKPFGVRRVVAFLTTPSSFRVTGGLLLPTVEDTGHRSRVGRLCVPRYFTLIPVYTPSREPAEAKENGELCRLQ